VPVDWQVNPGAAEVKMPAGIVTVCGPDVIDADQLNVAVPDHSCLLLIFVVAVVI
jgi:hypothetical protein